MSIDNKLLKQAYANQTYLDSIELMNKIGRLPPAMQGLTERMHSKVTLNYENESHLRVPDDLRNLRRDCPEIVREF